MHRGRFRKLVDDEAIRKAIEAAEGETSGEIRVSVSTFFWGSVRRAAERAFVRLGMTATKDRNGILFFVVPSRRRFVILGDEGIHAKVGQEFWDRVAGAVSGKFHAGDFTGGLVAGISAAGQSLAEHFPYQGERDVNELPDAVDFGGDGGSAAPDPP
jgi:uncharacterized membrane protein